jgi:hypothetical protein
MAAAVQPEILTNRPLARYVLGVAAFLLFYAAAGSAGGGEGLDPRWYVATLVFLPVCLAVWLVVAVEAWREDPPGPPVAGSARHLARRWGELLLVATLLTVLALLPRGHVDHDLELEGVFIDTALPEAHGWPWPVAVDLTGFHQTSGWRFLGPNLAYNWLFFAGLGAVTLLVAALARRLRPRGDPATTAGPPPRP